MKNIFLILISFLIIPSIASAEYWCQWDGSAGTNCRPISGASYKLPSGKLISTDEANMNSFGYYKVTTTEPTIGTDEKRGAIQWGKVDNQISRTWAVDAMSQAEIDLRDNLATCADKQSVIWLAKILVDAGVLTGGDFSAEETEIYQACQALE